MNDSSTNEFIHTARGCALLMVPSWVLFFLIRDLSHLLAYVLAGAVGVVFLRLWKGSVISNRRRLVRIASSYFFMMSIGLYITDLFSGDRINEAAFLAVQSLVLVALSIMVFEFDS